MDSPATVSATNFRIVATVLPTLACIVTLIRLTLRTRSRLWWWDDSFALLSMTCIIALVGGLWAHTADPASLTRTHRIAAYYVSALFFYSVNWAARLSILFTVVRIAPFPRQRRVLSVVAFAFICAWAFLSAQTIWICEDRGSEWKDLPAAACNLGDQSGIAQLVLESLADILLISIPVHFLRKTSLRKGVKVRLIAVFSTSAVTTIVALIHASFILRFGGLTEAMAAVVEDAVALAVCNLSVIVPVIARVCNGGGVFDPNSEDIPMSTMHAGSYSSRPSNNATTPVLIAPARAPDITVGLDTGSGMWQAEHKDDSEDTDSNFDKLPSTSIP